MARGGLENPRGRQLVLNLFVICSKCYLIQYQNSHYALFGWPLDLLFFSPYLFYPVLSAQRINHRFTIFFHCGTKKTIAKNASSGLEFRRRACGKNLFAPLFQCPPKPKSNNCIDIYFWVDSLTRSRIRSLNGRRYVCTRNNTAVALRLVFPLLAKTLSDKQRLCVPLHPRLNGRKNSL